VRTTSAIASEQLPPTPASTCGPTYETAPHVVTSSGSGSRAPVPLSTATSGSPAPRAGSLASSRDTPLTTYGPSIPTSDLAVTTAAGSRTGAPSGSDSAAAAPDTSSSVPACSLDAGQIAPRTCL
jgi:hypothetical protein